MFRKTTNVKRILKNYVEHEKVLKTEEFKYNKELKIHGKWNNLFFVLSDYVNKDTDKDPEEPMVEM